MTAYTRRDFLRQTTSLAAAATLGWQSTLAAAVPPGVETVADPLITGEERSAQPRIWALEVRFKSLRMLSVDIPDPKTGQVKKELIWYLPYRIINRRIVGLPEPKTADGKQPLFSPEFKLITDDNNTQKIYGDEVIPAAQAAINKREKQKYKNSVEIVGSIPELTAKNAKLEKSIAGVAMWRGIDPKTDNFKIFMIGFSNGFRMAKTPRKATEPPNKSQIPSQEEIQRRTLVQEFWRPGDEFDEQQREIRQKGKPHWVYH